MGLSDDLIVATGLLTNCDFNKGIVSGLPASTGIAHKFGEYHVGEYHELHESAIVYLSNKHYLLTVMTRGNDLEKLSGVIGQISRLAYDRIG